ncbi:MAG: hypothetical protein P1U65_05700 [Minwuia sp.]|nr:hypothetical protein [Minwuia sp.]
MGDDERQELAEKRLDTIKSILGSAWRSDPVEVQVLIDRLTVETLVDKISKPRRQVYRALIDYLEDALEEREDADPEEVRQRTGRQSYLQRLIKGLD